MGTRFAAYLAENVGQELDNKKLLAFDPCVVFYAAMVVRYGESSADRSGFRDMIARRAAGTGLSPESYVRSVLVALRQDEVRLFNDKLPPEQRAHAKCLLDFTAYFVSHPDAVDAMARDLWRGLSGEGVDLSPRMGVSDQDLELEVAVKPWIVLYVDAFENLTAKSYNENPWFAAACRWLDDKSLYFVPTIFVVKDAAARDAYARWLYLCWEKYLEMPDEVLIKNRKVQLGYIVLSARNDMPTVLSATTRDRLGIAPERWRGFVRFVKESRSGVYADQFGFPRMSQR